MAQVTAVMASHLLAWTVGHVKVLIVIKCPIQYNYLYVTYATFENTSVTYSICPDFSNRYLDI